jgi:hypothetical protein
MLTGGGWGNLRRLVTVTGLVALTGLFNPPDLALPQRQAPPCNNGSKKIALVIGNGNYSAFLPKPRNTVNGAKAIAEKLCSVGFKVIYKYDQKLDSLNQAVETFGSMLQGSDVGLFYYAGHALQVDGYNYLIPVDANIQSLKQVSKQACNFNLILNHIAQSKTRIIIMDACRNNSLSEEDRTNDGLAKIEAPSETLVAYATTPRQVALEGDGNLTPYTQELILWIDERDLEIEIYFRRIRIIVGRATNYRQRPWVDSSLTKAFYFNPSPKPQAVSKFWFQYNAGPPLPGKREWQLIDDMVWIERYPEFRPKSHPNGFESTFSIIGRATIEGDTGTIVRKIDGREDVTRIGNGAIEVFIPDKGSRLQWVRFRHYFDGQYGSWAFLGEMRDIQ